ncbi:uncharacterized protein HMPREF1541_00871 [Cyphellophora europaea CBS 101466]|uniref:Uncharacterized protein n=1 Tax=Cyphellophora europaea (strain CBS 101466) TaxID=1220924 RepID=W2SFJ9_CYPE1|nr:uncharacterized protein HMPREF1541_00871 [Cyphellophora europaea CBS 101466]ETN46684.1 hypothetical protein HMPREF1541_00871 [Cyphellophora europaea CBS 101466]
MAAVEPQKEKKKRFSRLLGTKREKSPESPPTFPPDSAYASSDTPITPATDNNKSTSEIVPAEKNSEIANIDKDRNLGVRPATGEVLDRDTGEVVTVVTTTTTTTTTTTRKPGQKPGVQKDVQKDVQESTQTQPAITDGATSTTADRSGVVEMPATPAETQPASAQAHHQAPPASGLAPAVTDRSSSNRLRKQSPGIPPRSNRRSGDRSTFGAPPSDAQPETGYFARPGPTGNTPPLSPARASNFSYPSRNRDSMDPDGVSLVTTDHPTTNNKSTISDLRAAAKGIHGVGETLRGTLNSTIDQNFPRKNDKKAAKANAKNDAVLARGRNEVAGIPHHRENQPAGYTHLPQQQQHAGAHPPPPMPAGAPPVKPPSPKRTATSEQTIPGSWSPEYDDGPAPTTSATGGLTDGRHGEREREREKEKSKSISKLFKRKPVAAKEGELRVMNP